MKVIVREKILRANNEIAAENRQDLVDKQLLTINMVSSPGAGKTTILEKMIPRLKPELKMAVIEGDVYTTKDAERIESQGVPVIQINTEGGCHLDANMVAKAIKGLEEDIDLADADLLIIENVGNLVCPAGFDLGEDFKVAILSIAEGADKVAKYPAVFMKSEAVILNKADLLPYTDFDLEAAKQEINVMRPGIPIFVVSARTGEGIDEWCDWLRARIADKQKKG